MKKINVLIIMFVVLVAFSAHAQKNEEKVAIKSSIVCFMCKRTIEYDLTFEKGVKTVNVDIEKKLVEVFFNPKKTSLEAIKKRLSKIGYSADEVKADAAAYEDLPNCCKAGDCEDCEIQHRSKEGDSGKDGN